MANTQLHKKLSIQKIIEKFTTRPREILNIPVPEIKEGSKANLTVFNPDVDWTFTKDQIKSKSQNTPFLNYKFSGKALMVVNNNMVSDF